MRRYKAIIPIIMLGAVGLTHSTLLYPFSLWGVRPDFVLLIAVVWSLLKGPEEGMLWGFIGGTMLDLLSGAPFGICILAMVATCFLVSLGQMSLFPTNITLPLVAMCVATITYYFFYLLLLRTTGSPVAWREIMVRIVLPATLLNELCTPFVYEIMRRFSVFSQRFGW